MTIFVLADLGVPRGQVDSRQGLQPAPQAAAARGAPEHAQRAQIAPRTPPSALLGQRAQLAHPRRRMTARARARFRGADARSVHVLGARERAAAGGELGQGGAAHGLAHQPRLAAVDARAVRARALHQRVVRAAAGQLARARAPPPPRVLVSLENWSYYEPVQRAPCHLTLVRVCAHVSVQLSAH